MKVLILGLNYAPEKVGIAVYTTGLAEYLSVAGHDVRVIAGQPYYPYWKVMDGFPALSYTTGQENGVRVTRTPHYVPSAPSGGKRLLHHATFAHTSFWPGLWSSLTDRPDVVIAIAPSLVAAPSAWVAAKLSGAKSMLHIQDFEVEAAFATGLMADNTRIASIARNFERWVLQRFDAVTSISPQMCRKLAEKGIARSNISEFRNWADIAAITPLNRPSTFREKWKITTPHVALYSGNIANKQGIDIIVKAAHMLRENEDLTFVICGDGPNRPKLEELAEGLPNIQFHELQPKEDLNELMALGTIHILPQTADAADLVLPSKLANMLASGRPVIATAAPGTGLANEVEGCGIVTPPADAAAMATAIQQLMKDAELHRRLSVAARIRAERRWSGEAILKRCEETLIALCGKADEAAPIADVVDSRRRL